MNQFDNARFLHNTEINLLDQQLMNYIDFTYDILKNNYPQLIKTDKAWSEFVDKNIFTSFKLTYFNNTQKTRFNDFILLLSLKYDIVRLNNILQNYGYCARKYFFNNRYMSINIDTFLLLLTTTRGLPQFPVFSSFYFNDTHFVIDYINVRVILPVYSVLISFFLRCYANYANYSQKIFILKVFKLFIKDFNDRVNSTLSINKEYVEKMSTVVELISNYFQDIFINRPSVFNLRTLFYLKLNKLNKNCIDVIMNRIQKKCYSYKLLLQIKDCCELTEQQNELINSNILLKIL